MRLSALTALFAALMFLACGHAFAQCPNPNPNASGPPFVDNCAIPAAALNRLGGVLNYLGFGVSTLNMYVSTAGSDTTLGLPNWCLFPALPCATISHAAAAMAYFSFLGNSASINIVTPGTYVGTSIAGNFMSASGGNREPCLFIQGTGDATTGTVTSIPGAAAGGIEVSGNACVVLKNLDFAIPANGGGFFTQDGGSHILLGANVSCSGPTSGTEAQYCGHAEGGAYIEVVGPSPQLTFGGKFAWLFTVGVTPGKLTFDPSANGTFNCVALTVDPAGGSFLNDGSTVVIAQTWSWDSNCAAITGHPVVGLDNSRTINLAGAAGQIPNQGSMEIEDNSTFTPTPAPGLGTCANGAIVNSSPINSTNNYMNVAFTGANSTCTIAFGEALNAEGQKWFTNTPFCTASVSAGTAVKYVVVNALANQSGVTLIPSSAFGNDDNVIVSCHSPSG
ncbi:MAG TPA: hypothetical protein VNU19_07115 [Candidatus Acidoferrum sp.]|nr:hypothetical protein [Candidatus Acidoferrum sp.]